jgi:two-component system nitrate/nitrite response regulator NarL
VVYDRAPVPRIRVFVADDHPVFREGLVRAVAARAEMELAGEAIDGRATLDAIRLDPPDVAVVDLRLPVLDGIAVARAVVREGIATRIVILSAYDDAELVWSALEAGAAGYLTKDARRDEITDGVLAASRGETVLAPSLASALAGEVRRRAGTPVLTTREREALSGLVRGLSAPAIARELVLSTATVKTHLQHLYEKLGVSDRAAAVAEAMRRGLIE